MFASAGRKASSRSSATVTSTAVPKCARVVRRLSSPSGQRSRSGTAKPRWPGPRRRAVDRRRASNSTSSASRRASGLRTASSRRRSRMCHAHSSRLTIARRHAIGMKQKARDVDGRREQRGRGPVGHDGERGVRRDEIPATVDDHRRIGHVPCEHALERGADRREPRIVEARLRIGRRVAGGQQQRVALAQRHLERLGEADDHRSARQRPSALDEAHVALGGPGAQRQLELADPPPLPPAAQLVREASALHAALSSPSRAPTPFPAGNCAARRPRTPSRP